MEFKQIIRTALALNLGSRGCRMKGDCESGNRNKDDASSLPAQIPVGWQRKVEDGIVTYLSPSGAVLCSVEEAATYLLTEGTCKCGLECPLVLHKVFNFDPGILVPQRRQQMGKIEGDMTKLCNHRRKVVAMATLCQSMHTSLSPPSCHHTVDGLSRSHPSEEFALIHVPGDMEASTVHNGSLPFQDLKSHIIGVLGQLSTSTSVSLVENTSVVRLSEISHQNSNDAGPFLSVSLQSFTETKLPDTGPSPTSPSVPPKPISIIPRPTSDRLLHLLPATPGSPHFLEPLPVGLGAGGQHTQPPQGNSMPFLLGPENLPVNCLSLLNPLSASGQGGEATFSPVPEIDEDTTNKNSSPAQQFLPSLLASGVLGNLTALSTVNNFDSLLGSGPLLLPPMPTTAMELPPASRSALSVSLLEAQAAEINPATCIVNNIQLGAIPSSAMEVEKPVSSLGPLSFASQQDVSTNNLSQEAVENPHRDLGPIQQQMEAKGGSFNPYISFMDTIYESFLQVSNKNTEGGAAQATPPPLLPQPSAPMSLSPLRAFFLRNTDLSQLSMEVAQSPTPGTPKPSEVDPSHLSQSTLH
ncbi:methyl-CpG-binding domain protein 6-like isoform X5 [Scleropages formosus]|uniref:methyl-CpG-binding domain protein 6-like isoform X5 n=1 Tax=Scleropages formosus TaxID=113540 RepID=UPI0010FA67B7|nr:methyl-CpG-binding domain protein 6-like isoform X5 [Scleropages formosus]